MLKYPEKKKSLKSVCFFICLCVIGFPTILFCQESSGTSNTFIKASNQQISDSSYLQGVEYAAEGKFKEAGEQFAQALKVNEFNYDAEVALDIINALNKGTINENYAITTFTSRLVKLKLTAIENLIKETRNSISASNARIENMEKELSILKKQTDGKMFELRSKIDNLERDINFIKNKDNGR
jgi:polyhydroxyalkanoate synthesis regulator phasin